ncbi:unnamed protein product [Pleuronectes platessa]|uniref:Fibronectin type-III domain-containing protein n=1 Tax=Pleuronectes platessa TaxID=8262 RepID=A0A9N7VT88_PLEPL|nr:unnamed protein product [Pleuronectes platessa]
MGGHAGMHEQGVQERTEHATLVLSQWSMWGQQTEANQAEWNSSLTRSQTNTALIQSLKPGTIYIFQVRARTVAGFGRFSGKMHFQTMTEDEYNSSIQEKLPLIIGSAAAGVVFIIAISVFIIVCHRLWVIRSLWDSVRIFPSV